MTTHSLLKRVHTNSNVLESCASFFSAEERDAFYDTVKKYHSESNSRYEGNTLVIEPVNKIDSSWKIEYEPVGEVK